MQHHFLVPCSIAPLQPLPLPFLTLHLQGPNPACTRHPTASLSTAAGCRPPCDACTSFWRAAHPCLHAPPPTAVPSRGLDAAAVQVEHGPAPARYGGVSRWRGLHTRRGRTQPLPPAPSDVPIKLAHRGLARQWGLCTECQSRVLAHSPAAKELAEPVWLRAKTWVRFRAEAGWAPWLGAAMGLASCVLHAHCLLACRLSVAAAASPSNTQAARAATCGGKLGRG